MQFLRKTAWLLLLVVVLAGNIDWPQKVFASPDISSNLIFHYDFEDSGNLGTDISGNANNASVGTGVAAQVDGTRGNVAKFTKASAQDYLVTPVNNPTTSYTQSAWVYLTTSGGNQSIFGTASGGSGKLSYLYVPGNRAVRASNDQAAGAYVISYDTVTNGVWYNIARVYNSTTGVLSIYVNGVLWMTGDVAVPGSNRIIIGSHLQPTTFGAGTSTLALDGYLDDVREYSRALTAEDIRGIYFAEGGSVSTPTNVSAYPVDNGMSLNWDDTPATDFIIEYKLTSEPTTWSTFADGTSSYHGTVVTGLTNGLSYDFRVSSTDGVTTSSVSSTVTATPVARGLWVPVFVHDSTNAAVYSSATRWSEAKLTNQSSADPLAEEKFSVLSHIENFRDSGDSDLMTFKIMYPDLDDENSTIWKQYSNPANDMTDSNNGVTGYEEILTEYYLLGPDFIGLEYNGGGNTFIDGGPFGLKWFSVGVDDLSVYNGTNGFSPNDFRGPEDLGVDQVRLFIRNPFYTGVPEKVLNLKGVPGNSQMYLYWQEVFSANPAITDYKVEYKLTSEPTTWSTFADGTSTNLYAKVTGLSNGNSYDFRVSGVNASGDGVVSDTLTYTINQRIIYHILSAGQSLSLGAEGLPPISLEQPYSNFMLYGDPSVTNNAGPVGKDSPLIPLIETFEYLSAGKSETPSSGIANSLAAYDDPVNPERRFVVGLHGMGGSAYSVIKKGGTGGSSAGYSRGQTQASTTKTYVQNTFADEYRPLAVTLIHGESDAALGNGAGDPATYEGYLAEMQGDYESDFNTLTGRSDHIPLFYSQENTTKPQEMSVAQYQAHSRYDNDIYLVGPTYQYPFSADDLHMINTSYRRLGEQFAKVMEKVLFNSEDWDPLMPRVVARNGANVYVWYYVPVPPLVLDTTLVVQRTDGNYGFEFYQTGGTTTLSSVALDGNEVVHLTLSGAPDGTSPHMKYAAKTFGGGSYHGDPTDPDQNGGNLRDSDTSVSPASDSSGEYLYDWAVSFDEAITNDTTSPTVTITAPTTSSSSTITDTTIQVIDDIAVLASDVTVGGGTTATTSSFSCTQTSNTQVDCTINVTASGDLEISADDLVGNSDTDTQAGYDIGADVTQPTVTSIVKSNPATSPTNATSLVFRVTFSEDMTDFDDLADVSLSTTGTASGSVSAISPVSADVYDVTISSVTGSGDISIAISSVSATTDLALNNLSSVTPTGSDESYTVDHSVPTVASIVRSNPASSPTNATSLVFRVTFSEDMTDFDDLADISLSTTGSASGSVSSISPVSADVYDVTIASVTGSGDVSIAIASVSVTTDLASNNLSSVTPTGSNQSYTVDNTAPTVTSIVKSNPATSPTNATSLVFRVTFSEDMTDFDDLADVSLSTTGTASGSVSAISPVSADVYDVTISSVTGSGDISIAISSVSATTDLALNNLSSVTPTGSDESYTVDNTDPVVTITSVTTSSTSNITDTTIQVTDNAGVLTSGVSVDGSSTAGTSSLNCAQTTATQVDCTIVITSSGDLVISADDSAGNSATDTETGYTITSASPTNNSGGSRGGGVTSWFNLPFWSSQAPVTSEVQKSDTDDNSNNDNKCIGTVSSALLKQGNTGPDVISLQQFLITSGALSGQADGIFGPQTKNAVINFQKQNGLISDGLVGKATLAKMNSCSSASSSNSTADTTDNQVTNDQPSTCDFSPAKYGDRGNNVKSIQNFLNSKSYNAGIADGIFGLNTVSATKLFQETYRAEILVPAGISNPTGWFYGNTIKKAKELCS